MAVQKGRRIRLSAAVCAAAAAALFLTFRSPRRIAVGDVRPYMNFRTVRVEGELVKPAARLKSGAVLYLVHDGTGRIAVFAPVPEDGLLYGAGCRIRAEGSLRTGVGNNKSLQASEVVLLEEAGSERAGMRPAQVGRRNKGDIVCVQGTVSRIWTPKEGSRAPHKIVLEDSGGRLDVVHWLEDPPELEAGDSVEVTGRVQIYDGRAELRVFEASAIKRCSSLSPTP